MIANFYLKTDEPSKDNCECKSQKHTLVNSNHWHGRHMLNVFNKGTFVIGNIMCLAWPKDGWTKTCQKMCHINRSEKNIYVFTINCININIWCIYEWHVILNSDYMLLHSILSYTIFTLLNYDTVAIIQSSTQNALLMWLLKTTTNKKNLLNKTIKI